MPQGIQGEWCPLRKYSMTVTLCDSSSPNTQRNVLIITDIYSKPGGISQLSICGHMSHYLTLELPQKKIRLVVLMLL